MPGVSRLDTGMAWAEDPPSRTRHLIANIEVEPGDTAGELKVSANFMVYRVVDQLSWSTSLYCVNFKGCTRLINATGTFPSQRMLMFARPRLDIVEPLHIPIPLVLLSY